MSEFPEFQKIERSAISYAVGVQPPTPKAPIPTVKGPKRLDPAAARKRRQAREQGFDFVLQSTLDDDGNPSIVRARIPQLLDADSLSMLSADMRREIFKMIEEVQQMEGFATGNGAEAVVASMQADELADTFGAITKVVDAYCVMGFVEPRCYFTVDEADAKNGVWVRDIEFSDRLAFFNHCSQQERGAAAKVTPFPDGQPVSVVGAGPVDPAVSGAGQPEHGAAPEPAPATGGLA